MLPRKENRKDYYRARILRRKGFTVPEIIKQLGGSYHFATVYEWVADLKYLVDRKKRQRQEEIETQAKRMFKKGVAVRRIAQKLGVDRWAIRKIVGRESVNKKITTGQTSEIERLTKEGFSVGEIERLVGVSNWAASHYSKGIRREITPWTFEEIIADGKSYVTARMFARMCGITCQSAKQLLKREQVSYIKMLVRNSRDVRSTKCYPILELDRLSITRKAIQNSKMNRVSEELYGVLKPNNLSSQQWLVLCVLVSIRSETGKWPTGSGIVNFLEKRGIKKTTGAINDTIRWLEKKSYISKSGQDITIYKGP